nr:ribonuclease H-like domain-containing protein [Tanacetum cinerariifolium]
MPLKRNLKVIDEHFESESVDVSTVSSSVDKTVKTIDITHKDDDSEDELSPTVEVITVKPSVEKIESVKTPRETVKIAESQKPHTHYPRGNKRNWNNLMSHRLGILTQSAKINTIAASVNTNVRPVNAADSQSIVNHFRPISKVIPRRHSQQIRPFNKLSSNKRSVFNKKVNTVRVNDSTAREGAVVSGNIGREQKEHKEKGGINSGCSRHMTGNKCYLTDFEAFDCGFVSFGDGKGRISGKGKIKIGKLDFNDVYFCKELVTDIHKKIKTKPKTDKTEHKIKKSVEKQSEDVCILVDRPIFIKTQKTVLLLAWDRVFKIKDARGNKQYKPDDTQELFRELFNDVQNIHEELAEYINTPGWNRPAFYDDDDDDDVDYTITITPVLSTEEPNNSLSMGDEHLDTIPAMESDEVLKSSVENLIPIPSESEGIPEHMCDVPFHDNSPPLDVSKDQFEDFS